MKKVLIVDDTKNIRMLLSKCLELEGFEVDTAADGLEAVRMLSKNDYDLAFLDIKLPEISGTEVLKRIRGIGVDVPVIIITAYATVKNAVDCTKLGSVAYLQKPFTGDKVVSVLKELKLFKDDNTKPEKDSLTMAKELLEKCNYKQALDILKAIAARELDNPDIYLLISEAYEGMGEKKLAEKFLNVHKLFKN